MMKKRSKNGKHMSLFDPPFSIKKEFFFDQKCRFGVLMEKREQMIKKRKQTKKHDRYSLAWFFSSSDLKKKKPDVPRNGFCK